MKTVHKAGAADAGSGGASEAGWALQKNVERSEELG